MKFIAMAHLPFNTFRVLSVPSSALWQLSFQSARRSTVFTLLWAVLLFCFLFCLLRYDTYLFFLSAAIVTAYETNTQHDPNNNNAMLGVHASASAIIQYGKIGRKQVLCHPRMTINSTFCFAWVPSFFFFFLNVFVKLHHALSPGSGECGSRHPESYPHHPHSAHCRLLPEDQTASQMLFAAGWRHGQEWVHAGKNVTFSQFNSFI